MSVYITDYWAESSYYVCNVFGKENLGQIKEYSADWKFYTDNR